MAEYIEREKIALTDFEIAMCKGSYKELCQMLLDKIKSIPAADVLPRDEGIKLGAELAAMHGATPEQQQLEKAYLKGVEYGMTRRDVRPVMHGKWALCLKGEIACTNCGARTKKRTNYCPNCGALMEGNNG